MSRSIDAKIFNRFSELRSTFSEAAGKPVSPRKIAGKPASIAASSVPFFAPFCALLEVPVQASGALKLFVSNATSSVFNQLSPDLQAQRETALEFRDSLLGQKELIAAIRDDLEQALQHAEADQNAALLASEESATGDGEADVPANPWEGAPNAEVLAARRKLAVFEGLLTELGEIDFYDGPDIAISLEELSAVVADFIAYEEEWTWNDLKRRLEAVEALDGKHPKVKELQAEIAELRGREALTVEDYLQVLAKANVAALWTSVEARIEQYGEMAESTAITDMVVKWGGIALKGPIAYHIDDAVPHREDEFTTPYLAMRSEYQELHRLLEEGEDAQAQSRFVALETSEESRILLDAIHDSARINQCTASAAIVIASAATGGLAAGAAGRLAQGLGLAGRGLEALKFGVKAAGFTVVERRLTTSLQEKEFFDPKKSRSENWQGLGVDMLLNAGMFAFLGGALRGFERKVILPFAERRALATKESIATEREILLNQFKTGVPLRAGRFTSELGAFGAWDGNARNIRENIERLKSGKDLGFVFPAKALLGTAAWEDRFITLLSLKAGHAFGKALAKPVEGAASFLKNNISPTGTAKKAADPESPPVAAGILSQMDPQEYRFNLRPENQLDSGALMEAYAVDGDPSRIFLVLSETEWNGQKMETTNPEFSHRYIRETLEHYDRVKDLDYRGGRLAPRIDAVLSDGEGNPIGFLMEKMPGKSLYDLIEAGKISPEQMETIETMLKEQLEILHSHGLAHGDPQFQNVFVQTAENGEILDASFIDFTRPHPDKVEPNHGTPAYDIEVFHEDLEYYWKKITEQDPRA